MSWGNIWKMQGHFECPDDRQCSAEISIEGPGTVFSLAVMDESEDGGCERIYMLRNDLVALRDALDKFLKD